MNVGNSRVLLIMIIIVEHLHKKRDVLEYETSSEF